MSDGKSDPRLFAQLEVFERWNLILVLLVVQIGQVLLLAVSVFGRFMLFRALVMKAESNSTGPGMDNLHV